MRGLVRYQRNQKKKETEEDPALSYFKMLLWWIAVFFVSTWLPHSSVEAVYVFVDAV